MRPGPPSGVLAAEAMSVDTAGSAGQDCANAEVVRLMHDDSTEASGRTSDAPDKCAHCSQPCGETIMRPPRGYAMVTQKRSPTTCFSMAVLQSVFWPPESQSASSVRYRIRLRLVQIECSTNNYLIRSQFLASQEPCLVHVHFFRGPVRALQMPSFPHSRPAGFPLRESHVPVNECVKLMSELCCNGGTVYERAIHVADRSR
ncbi:uncharacterized protein CC84DRAFT_1178279 [Paraphaeosphaeria sporulosa]|uniref:Uncharacterized protein n=1 Tax=Paraphaeosphaeria sporulosa TaxID=1460663 RepID=A0A177C7B7_9PLEO|nr:uncharacterized protein CC84DRAFT_1178279 [Paraphaeosphaeria sporulosa]OAG02668.1 hypothetical protein CC84DRAFT_1178279 [Paraphaeosphaeria sporulosa]